MKHASDAILKRLRAFFIIYSAYFVIGYLCSVLIGKSGWAGTAMFHVLAASIAGAHLLYEVYAQFTLQRKKLWLSTVISFLAVVLVTSTALEYTGVYRSPYAVMIVVLTFLAGALSQYLAYGIGFIFLIGFLLSLAHVFTSSDGGPVAGLIFMIVEAAAAIGAHFFWSKRYTAGPGQDVEALSRSLKSSQAQSNIMLEAIADGVVLIDDQHIIRLFNPGATTVAGWKREEAIGLDWRSVFKFVNAKEAPLDEDATPFIKAFQQAEPIRDNTTSLLTKSNKPIALNITVSPLTDDNKRVTGVVGIFRDVSQERQEESQRAEFISTASHEMRTPVAAIEGYLSLALNDKVSTIDSRAREYLEKAHASTQHLGKLFQDLLTSAKAEDGRLSSHPVVIEVGGYLEQITQDLKFAAEKKGLAMEFTVGSSQTIDATSGAKVVRPLYYILADPDRLREVITNLFDNAVKYTDQGKVTIGLTGNEQVVQFYVRDTGPGIPAEDQPHLFQKFYRVDNSATRTIGGTGLGLFICRKIVEMYQGRIWVESQLDKGSTFFINFPRLSAQKAQQLQATEAKSTTLAPITSLTAS